MQIDYERVHAVADEMIAFANAMRSGWVKHWKAHSMCVTIAQLSSAGAEMQGERLIKYVRNCLEMEGFSFDACIAIADWLDAKLINNEVTA